MADLLLYRVILAGIMIDSINKVYVWTWAFSRKPALHAPLISVLRFVGLRGLIACFFVSRMVCMRAVVSFAASHSVDKLKEEKNRCSTCWQNWSMFVAVISTNFSTFNYCKALVQNCVSDVGMMYMLWKAAISYPGPSFQIVPRPGKTDYQRNWLKMNT